MARRCSTQWRRFVGLVATILLVGFILTVHGRLILATLIPCCNVIVLGNWTPCGAAFLGGMYMRDQIAGKLRRTITLLTLMSLAWYTVLAPVAVAWVVSPGPNLSEESLCQDSQVSCSAACAARLLVEHGIEATEPEMIRLCLTNGLGTPPLGLYRGLKIKTRGTDWDVEIIRCGIEELRGSMNGPMIVRVRLFGPQMIPCWPASRADGHPGSTTRWSSTSSPNPVGSTSGTRRFRLTREPSGPKMTCASAGAAERFGW